MSMSERERLTKLSRFNEIAQRIESGAVMTTAIRDEFYELESELRDSLPGSGGQRASDADVEAASGRAMGGSTKDTTEEDRAFDSYLRIGDTHGLHELRVSTGWTTQASDTTLASYTIPQGFWANLQVALKAYGGISADFRLVQTDNGRAMPWPVIDPTGQTASLVGTELTQLTTASPFVFGTGTLNAWTYATNPVLISLQASQDSEFDLGAFLAERIGEQLGRSFAAAAISGTGSSQPQGIITGLNAKGTAGTVGGAIAATGGFVTLATAASVKTFAAPAGATELVGNVLSPATCLAMVSAVDPAYYGAGEGCKWYMNNTMAMNQHAVIDSQGRPLLNLRVVIRMVPWAPCLVSLWSWITTCLPSPPALRVGLCLATWATRWCAVRSSTRQLCACKSAMPTSWPLGTSVSTGSTTAVMTCAQR